MYFLFAALDVAIILASLSLQHTTLASFENLINESEKITIKQKQVSQLRSQLLQLNAPGNDVFQSRDVDKEELRFEDYLNQIQKSLASFRQDLDLVSFEKNLSNMLASAVNIFDSLKRSKNENQVGLNMEEIATASMARMDQYQALAMEDLKVLEYSLLQKGQVLLENQHVVLLRKRSFEMIFFIFVLIAVVGILYFGRRMHRAFEKSSQEKNQLIQDLQDSQEKLQIAAKAKSDFLANMSHEIRTPMNAILGFSDLLGKTSLNEGQGKYVKTILSSGQLLLGIINDILDFSKFESGKIQLEEIDFILPTLIDDVFKMVSTRVKSQGDIDFYLDIAADVPMALKGDPTRLKQIFVNLLSNAVKFTSKGDVGVIIRRASAQEIDGRVELTFIVKDTGIGISKDKQALLFQSFTQVDSSTTRKFGGTGLGLAISKKIVEAFHGTIRIESDANKGSEFIFTLSLLKGEPIVNKFIETLSVKQLAGKKVFIVDDNDRAREVLTQYIKEFSMPILAQVKSAKEALDELILLKTKGTLPDLILSDIRMPDMDGYMLASAIRQDKDYSKVKLIAVTSDVQPGVAEHSRESGFDGFITKPVFRDTLIEVIATIFGDYRDDKSLITRHTVEELSCKGTKILVVDDSAPNLQLMKAFLDILGCRSDFAADGKEAIDKLRASNDYQLCLMDIQMPVMGGVEATQIIRREISEKLPVLALTAAVLKEDQEKALASGMNDFLTKPIDMVKLKEKILQWRS